MTPFERLYLETAEARERFLAIPLVNHALATGGTRELYVAFLCEAYHHVKHTFPLLALASAHTRDERYQAALVEYMNEERGHDLWDPRRYPRHGRRCRCCRARQAGHPVPSHGGLRLLFH